MIRALRILEITWMIIAIAAAVLGSYKLYLGEHKDALLFYIFTVVAALFSYLRRRRRKAFEKESGS